MRKLVYLFICAPLLLSSCKKDVIIRELIVNDSLFQTIVVDPDDIDPKEPAEISDIAESVEYMPLQTADSILIGEIGKLIVWNGKYYIWDRLTEAIFSFDLAGRFIHKIQKTGQGPDEYPCISDFTMDMKNGDIYIHSDRTKAIYAYTDKGEFIKKTLSPFILCSFAVQGDHTYYYPGRMPNVEFYSETYPQQYRYVMMKNNELKHQQLKYTFDRKYLNVPLSNCVFSFYKDEILLVEDLNPQIYGIDSIGRLKPKYRIEFLTNTYSPSFDGELDVERMKSESKKGNLTTLFNGFYETDNYLFFSYAREIIGSVYVDKKDLSIHNMGYFLVDDFNKNSLPGTTAFVDEKYMYKTMEPISLIRRQTNGEYSPYLNEVVNKMREFDNPVIIKVKLK